MTPRRNAVVVGAGPNGLAAAVALARAGLRVEVLEAEDTIGGGTRTSELTGDGTLHDHCSAVHPMAAASPFLRSLDLHEHGLEWCWPEVDLAHPLDDGTTGVLLRSLDATAAGLGLDGAAWKRIFGRPSRGFEALNEDLVEPVLHVPRHPLRLARFGIPALVPATVLARSFETPQARALFGGVAAHALSPLTTPMSSAVGMALTTACHAWGWPVARGGSRAITDALASKLASLGGTVQTGVRVRSVQDLPSADAVVFDLAPRAVAAITGDRLAPRVARAYRRYRHGPGAFKVDLAVRGGVPWTSESARRAGTVHVMGTLEEQVAAERDINRGVMPERPCVLVAQQYLADPSRSNGDLHPVWSYAHVPSGYDGDATEAVLSQIERFAPGVRERIEGMSVRSPADLEAGNANYVGGDIITGANTPLQLAARPRLALDPYATGIPGMYICSAATPPGAGVHGMNGHNAARSALRHLPTSPNVRVAVLQHCETYVRRDRGGLSVRRIPRTVVQGPWVPGADRVMAAYPDPIWRSEMPAMYPRTLAVLAVAAAAATAPASAEAADGFACSASAISAKVLGHSADPVRAGAADGCPDATKVLDTLGAPLAADSASARTGRSGETTGAATALSGFRLDALAGLTPELPQIQVPAGLQALQVPLPGGALLGLPSSITVDATKAAQDMVAQRSLPDVPLMAADLVQTAVTAVCRTGRPVFDALSKVENLTALGQTLPTDRSIDTAVPLVSGQTVDFSKLDVTKVVLPGGLSLSDPLTGSILRSALQQAVAGLPTVSVPAEVARVLVEPASREDGSGSLRQFGPRVRVEALGREVADVRLGDALVSALGAVCAEAPAVAAAPVVGSPVSEAALECAKSDVVLTDVVEKDGKVKIVGIAAPRFVGREVPIYLTSAGTQVATAVVQPDGYFRTRAPLPAKKIRRTNDARYMAMIDGEKSLALKLHRRMRISRMKPAEETITIAGRIYGRMADDEVVITRRESCTKDVQVATVKPGRDGRWRITLPLPAGVDAATYRATATVRKGDNPKRFRTFTLPGHVSL